MGSDNSLRISCRFLIFCLGVTVPVLPRLRLLFNCALLLPLLFTILFVLSIYLLCSVHCCPRFFHYFPLAQLYDKLFLHFLQACAKLQLSTFRDCTLLQNLAQIRMESSGGRGEAPASTGRENREFYMKENRGEPRIVSSMCHDLQQKYPARDSRNFLAALPRLTSVPGPSPPPPPPDFPVHPHFSLYVPLSSRGRPVSLHIPLPPRRTPRFPPSPRPRPLGSVSHSWPRSPPRARRPRRWRGGPFAAPPPHTWWPPALLVPSAALPGPQQPRQPLAPGRPHAAARALSLPRAPRRLGPPPPGPPAGPLHCG